MSLAGCAAQAPPEDVPALPQGACKAEPAQSLVGRKADASVAAELLRLTGARTLRWVPPRSAVTMDYRADRLTVGYDDTYTIVRISCG
ncbi:MAG: I78 family peptidase inhibitor [Novosphingobium sp.]|nr:I78 family peptidase inhibitor [Novosphingobium sp.]